MPWGLAAAAAVSVAGDYLGGQSAKTNALRGFNYLTGPTGVQPIVDNARSASNAESDLLGLNGAAGGARSSPAFHNYLDSTGYNFQLDQGTRAITGSAAAKGLLNSGATGKALVNYGQSLASTTFDNYLAKLSGQTGQGLTASGQIGSAGTEGGATAAKAMAGADSGIAGTIAGLFG